MASAVAPALAESGISAPSPIGNGVLKLVAEGSSRVVVTQAEVQEAAHNSRRILVPAGAIVTPLAAELAAAQGVTIEREG